MTIHQRGGWNWSRRKIGHLQIDFSTNYSIDVQTNPIYDLDVQHQGDLRHRCKPTIKFSCFQSFCDIHSSLTQQIVVPMLLSKAGNFNISWLVRYRLWYRESEFWIPNRMLTTFYIDRGLLDCIYWQSQWERNIGRTRGMHAIKWHLSEDILLIEGMFVDQVSSFENYDN